MQGFFKEMAVVTTNGVLILVVSILLSTGKSYASDNRSFRSDTFLNPNFAIGYNAEDRKISGYIEALRTSPGNTEACSLYFVGAISGSATAARVSAVDASSAAKGIDVQNVSIATIDFSGDRAVFSMRKRDAPGNCDFVLGFLETRESSDGLSYLIDLTPSEFGDWIGVGIVQSKRAPIFSSANEASSTRSFLVKGDRFFVLKKNGSWINFKYEGRKKTSIGWIRFSDTAQFPQGH